MTNDKLESVEYSRDCDGSAVYALTVMIGSVKGCAVCQDKKAKRICRDYDNKFGGRDYYACNKCGGL